MTDKFVITGGPGTGKTTLFNSLKGHFNEAGFVEEPATAVFERNPDLAVSDNLCAFCEMCIEQSLASEKAVSSRADLIIQDRSLVDTVAYSKRDGCDRLLPRLHGLIEAASYSGAIVCGFTLDYKATGFRYEDSDLARQTHKMLVEAYESLNVPLVHLQTFDHQERIRLAVNFIIEHQSSNREQP